MKNIIAYAKRNQRGAILITLIVAIVIIGLSGVAMMHFSTTSSYGELIANRQQRAYYIGEAGANHAQQLFSMNKITNGPFPSSTVFTVGNDKFSVRTFDKPTDSTHLIIESTGIVGSGWLTTRQLITRDIVKATATPPNMPPIMTDSAGVPLGFDTDSNKSLDSTWTLATGTTNDEAYINNNKNDEGYGSLEFKERQAAILLNTSVVSLCNAWLNNGNLSSYFLQVKIKNIDTNPAYYMHGISFRVQDIGANNSYGLSFYKHINSKYKGEWCANLDWCEYDLNPKKVVNNGKIYAILWKRVNGVASLLAYTQMKTDTFSYGVTNTDGTELLAWSTLLIRVNERADGNHIKAYVQSVPTYPKDALYWNISSFKQVTWTWPSAKTEVVDNTFPSAGLCKCTAEGTCTANRPEIGIHAFYDNDGSGTQLFDDFSMAVQGTQSGTGGSSQY